MELIADLKVNSCIDEDDRDRGICSIKSNWEYVRALCLRGFPINQLERVYKASVDDIKYNFGDVSVMDVRVLEDGDSGQDVLDLMTRLGSDVLKTRKEFRENIQGQLARLTARTLNRSIDDMLKKYKEYCRA